MYSLIANLFCKKMQVVSSGGTMFIKLISQIIYDLMSAVLTERLKIVALYIHIYQPLYLGRIWHKVNF